MRYYIYTLMVSTCVWIMPTYAYAQVMPMGTTPGQVSANADNSNMGFDDDDNGNTLSSKQVQSMNQQSQNSMYNGFSSQNSSDEKDAGDMSEALNQADKEYKNPDVPFGSEGYAAGKIDSKTPFPYGAEYMKAMNASAVQKSLQSGDNACKDPFGGALPTGDTAKNSRLAAPQEEEGPVTTKIEGYGNELKWGDTTRCAVSGYPRPSPEASGQVFPGSDLSDAGDTTGDGDTAPDTTSAYATAQNSPDGLSNQVSSGSGNTGQMVASDSTPVASPALTDSSSARRALIIASGIQRPTPSFSAFVARLQPRQLSSVMSTMAEIRRTDPNRTFSEDDIRLLSGI